MAIEPSFFSKLVSQQALRSLSYLLDTPVPFPAAPDLFCLDFYKDFDLDRLIVMAEPTKVRLQDFVSAVEKGAAGTQAE